MTKPPRQSGSRDFTERGCADLRRVQAISRRRVLQAGGLGALGFSLPELWAAQASAGPVSSTMKSAGFGRAKSCIFLFMWGGPSQLDTFDPKPDAPSEVRGPFQPISTRVPGIQLSEHFRSLANLTDKVAILRSLNHDDPAHLSSGHLTLTGHLAPTIKSDAAPPSDRDTPHLGSMLARLRGSSGTLPPFVTLPWQALHPAAPGGRAPGQNAGWLGRKFDPLVATGDPNAPDWKVQELSLLDGVGFDRVNSRRELLHAIDQQRAELEAADLTGLKQKAFGLLASENARKAFDLSQEPDSVRQRYGRNIHGQCVLLARRLVEHGVPLVSVNWHNDGRNFWDTHGNNFTRLKNDLIPPADRALSALLEDLDQRGLLDETIIAWVGEFGRRPQIDGGNAAHAGRAHWPFCYSGLLAGGGIRGGTVYGKSDKLAAHPAELPVSPQDYAATLLHALGVAPQTTVEDRFGRPIRVCEGTPITALFG
ncbi:MAG: DUF1501 domain-containing protein [Planctomycetia bacterium]|nr:DUF1501 domain-containing protein [Planctomycetia bacterium]